MASKWIKVKGGYEDKIIIMQGQIEPTKIEIRTKSTEDTKRLMDVLKRYGELDKVWLNFDIKLGWGSDLS